MVLLHCAHPGPGPTDMLLRPGAHVHVTCYATLQLPSLRRLAAELCLVLETCSCTATQVAVQHVYSTCEMQNSETSLSRANIWPCVIR
jgi:hypothetical protein